jgi:hypothetical protein
MTRADLACTARRTAIALGVVILLIAYTALLGMLTGEA